MDSNPQKPQIPGLTLLEKIKSGRRNQVYRGLVKDAVFAVKIQNSSVSVDEGSSASQFFREAAFLACLNDQSLPRIFHVGQERDINYLVEEFVQGENLEDILKSRKRLLEEEILSLASHLGRALSKIHRNSLVHRNICPHNILINSQGRPYLLDFSLVTRVGYAPGEKSPADPVYSSPEQLGALSLPVDGRSDLYSLGVVLYQSLTGRLPFVVDPQQDQARHFSLAPVPPIKSLRPEINPALEKIVLRLLSKDPEDRYQNAETFLHDLRKIKVSSGEDVGPSARTGRNLGGLEQSQLIGRSDVVTQLKDSWLTVKSGRGRIVLVAGPSGMGKTRLVLELQEIVVRDGGSFFAGKSQLVQNPIPFGPIREMFNNLWLSATEKQRSDFLQLLGAESWVLSQVSSAIADSFRQVQLGIRSENLTADLYYQDLSKAILKLPRVFGPIVLFFDDIQWLDDSTRALLELLSSQLGESQILLLATSRTEEDGRAGVDSFLNSMESAGVAQMNLQPLTRHETGLLAASWLGDHQISKPVVDHIFNRTEGNPFAIKQLTFALLDAGALVPSWGIWTFHKETHLHMHLPANLLELLKIRIEKMDAESRHLLQMAALWGFRFEVETLSSIAGKSIGEIETSVREGFRLHLVDFDPSTTEWFFVHDKVVEGLLAILKSEIAAGFHAKAFHYLNQAFPQRNKYLYQIAEHGLQGSSLLNPQILSTSLCEAGEKSVGEFAFDQAYRFFSEASILQKSLGAPLPLRSLSLKAFAAAMTGRHEQALSEYAQVLSLETDPIERARAHYEIGRIYIFRRQIQKAWEQTILGLSILEVWIPHRPVLNGLRIVGQTLLGFLVDKLKLRDIFKVKGKEFARFQMAARFNEMGGVTAYFLNDPIKFAAIVSPGIYIAHRISTTSEVAFGYGAFAVGCSVAGLKSLAMRCMRIAVGFTDEKTDPFLFHRIDLYRQFMLQFLNSWTQARALGMDLILRRRHYLDAQDFMNGAYGGISCMTLLSGHHREGLAAMEKAQDYIQESKADSLYGEGHPFLSTLIPIEAVFGKLAQASLRAKRIRPNIERTPDDFSGNLGFYGSLLAFYYETQEIGPDIDVAIENGYSKMPKFFWMCMPHFKFFFVFECFARLNQFHLAAQNQKGLHLQKLRESYARLRKVTWLPAWSLIRAHAKIILSVLEWEKGQSQKAFRCLVQAHKLAEKGDLPWVHFEAYRLRARWLKETGSLEASSHTAQLASSIATNFGWVQKQRWIIDEFPEAFSMGAHTSLSQDFNSFSSLCVDMVGETDPHQQARLLLDRLNLLTGAERSLLFLADENATNRLQFSMGRTSDQVDDILSDPGISLEYIEAVLENRAAIYNSADVLSLPRSSIACPIRVQNKMLGVLYLENKSVRGLFQKSDKVLISTAASVFAAAVEATKAKQVEIDRMIIEQDLNLAGTVQRLLLPEKNRLHGSHFLTNGYFHPASRIGGDWWWSEELGDGSILVFVGDVTGHGPSSAVLTASVAGAFQLFREMVLKGMNVNDVVKVAGEFLKTIDSTLFRQGRGGFAMPFSMVLWTPTGELYGWGAGQPPMIAWDYSSKDVKFLEQGENVLGECKVESEPQFKLLKSEGGLFLYTDGLWNLKHEERNFNEKAILRMIEKMQVPEDGDVLQESLVELINNNLVSGNLEDDITYVIIGKLNLSKR